MRVSTEEWKFVPGTDECYAISDQGRLMSYNLRGSKIGTRVAEGRILNPRPNQGGYPIAAVRFGGAVKRSSIHSLVMLAFVGPRPQGMQVCHNDGNPANPRLSNLRYDTPTANSLDRRQHGTDNRGVKHGKAKLTEAMVREIRELCAAPDANFDAISRQFNITRCYARQIHIRKTWGWLV